MIDLKNVSGNEKSGTGKKLDDFSFLCEGDTDPTLKKNIKHLVDASKEYIVYLDNDYLVEWSLTDKYEASPEYQELVKKGFISDVLNKTSYLEALSILYFRTPPEPIFRSSILDKIHQRKCRTSDQLRLSFRRLLAEAPARIFGDKDTKNAGAALDKAEAYLKAVGKGKYIWGAMIAAVSTLIISIFFLFYKETIIHYFGRNAFEVGFGSLLGGIGAFGFLLTHEKEIILSPSGTHIHYMEGIYRISVGIICALVVALAIKANVMLGITKSLENAFAYSLVACMLSGVTERFGPDLIKNPIPSDKKRV